MADHVCNGQKHPPRHGCDSPRALESQSGAPTRTQKSPLCDPRRSLRLCVKMRNAENARAKGRAERGADQVSDQVNRERSAPDPSPYRDAS